MPEANEGANNRVQLEEGWLIALKPEFSKPYFVKLKQFLLAEKDAGKQIYPPGSLIFAAFNQTPLSEVKVVILGQDPYHGHGQAHGLAFSVNDGVRIPPSLQNIFKELSDDVGASSPDSGNLSRWAAQGVLLLNTVLTVEGGQANSHQNKGWEQFIDVAISAVSMQCKHVIFILWGKSAQSKAELIDTSKHLVLTAAHPSFYSANRGFFGSKPFSKANDWLAERGKAPINWKL